jgi:3-isopropylmalate/(R)-2-methylmalate dehydratase small subunit
MEHVYEGRAYWIYPDNFDVDQIVGPTNISVYDYDKLTPITMASFDESFPANAQENDILVAGQNFGAGHAHPQGMAVMRRLGIHVVIAESFNFAFYRSELIEAGMVLLPVPGVTGMVTRFDRLKVDYLAGTVENLSTGVTAQGKRPSPMEVELVETKDLLTFITSHLSESH